MGKKQVWTDNTMPPTNYIWVKTTDAGTIEGVYEHNGSYWVKIARSDSGYGDYVPASTGMNRIYATSLNGEQITIEYSVDPIPDTIAKRTDYGSLRAADPHVDQEQDLVTAKMLMWGGS